MRLLKESVLRIWKARKAAVREELDRAERAAKAIQQKLARLDEAFLFDRSIDIETYDRHAETPRGAHARADRPSLRPARRTRRGRHPGVRRTRPAARRGPLGAGVARSAAAVPTTVSPDGIAFDGNRFIRTGVTAPAFSYLRGIKTGNESLVDQTGIEPVTS